MAEGAGEPALAQATGPGDQQVAALGDPVAGGELEEQRAVEPARTLIVDVLDAGGMAQPGDPGARFELLLPAQRQLVFEQQAEPFGVIEAARFGPVFQFLESFGQAVKAKRGQMVERGMSEHEDILSMVIAAATQIGVVEQRGGAAVLGGGALGLAGEERGDALEVEDAQFDGAGGDRFNAAGIERRDTSARCPSTCGTLVRDAAGRRARR